MEEAYTELYREFICLRSLCLKQAALLEQLTAALYSPQGSEVNRLPRSSGPNGGCVGTTPIQDTPVPLTDGPEPLVATAANPGVQPGSHGPPRGVGTFSDLLAQDMGRLGLDVAGPRANQRPAERTATGKTLQTYGMPWACTQDSDFLVPAEGFMMSELALQSQVCEFCHAVFPGHTTTRGQYLHHLHTHIT